MTVEDVNGWPDILAAVTPDDIRAAAKLVLQNPATVTGWLLPEPGAAAAAPQALPAAQTGDVE